MRGRKTMALGVIATLTMGACAVHVSGDGNASDKQESGSGGGSMAVAPQPGGGGSVDPSGAGGAGMASPCDFGKSFDNPTGGMAPQAVYSMSLGYLHTCAVTVAQDACCWGANDHGEIGDGTTVDRLAPAFVARLGGNVAKISAGKDVTCAITNDGTVWCWGAGAKGMLGNGAFDDHPTPVAVDLAQGASALAVGENDVCAVTDGKVECWGANIGGELGGGTIPSATPVDIAGLEDRAVSVGVGEAFACALLANGKVQCWGDDESGELGDGGDGLGFPPADVLGISGATVLSVRQHSACVAEPNGIPASSLKCWGKNDRGQLGDGTTIDRAMPVYALPEERTGVIVQSGSHACSVAYDSLECWGADDYGQLGDQKTASTTAVVHPIDSKVGFPDLVEVGPSGDTCTITNGRIRCWGNGARGELGDGSTASTLASKRVTGL